MNNNLKGLLIFGIGLGMGAAGSYFFTKKKYEKIIDEEVTSARETYNRLAKDLADKNAAEKQKIFSDYKDVTEQYEPTDHSVEEGARIVNEVLRSASYETPIEDAPLDDDISESNEINEEEIFDQEAEEDEEPNDISYREKANEPFEIDAREYGMIDDYKLVSLSYYSNDILTNEYDEVVEDPVNLIGFQLFNKLPIYEENGIYTAYARNIVRKCDYEILMTSTDYTAEGIE